MHINNILLIDDDDAVGLILHAVLAKSEIIKKFNFCLSGAEALDFLSKSEQSNAFPDIVFVDLNMPEMNGYEFIPLYEHFFYEKFPNTKVVVVSSSSRMKDQQMAMSFRSVKRYINKPLTEEKILSVLV